MAVSGIFLSIALLQVASTVQVDVMPAAPTIHVGQTVTLQAQAVHADGGRVSDPVVTWLSQNTEIASVDPSGVVTGHRPGAVQITAMIGGEPGFAQVTVAALPAATMSASILDPVYVGTSAPILVLVADRFGARVKAPVTFASGDSTIATVDRHGRVYGHRAGGTAVHLQAGSARTTVGVRVLDNPFVRYRVVPAQPTARTGDVVRFRLEGHTARGETRAISAAWLTDGPGASITPEGEEGVLVAESPGTYRVVALINRHDVAMTTIDVVQRRVPARLTTIGRGPAATHHSGDTWAFEGVNGRDYAYVGTFMHDWMKVWDITDPATPILTDSLQLDARRINDVKIHPNSRIGIVTREGASDRRNGIVLLDLADPSHPRVLSEYTATVTGGVHNVWIDGVHDLVYAAHNGTSDMHIIDIANPARPHEVGRWGLDRPSGAKTLHDIIVQEGYAYLSYWDDGVIMLDIGAGTHGGSPTEPAFVSQFAYPVGNTHVAWRSGRYLFIGDEIFPPGWNADAPIEARGYIHVVDYEDPANPREVARYEVPEAGAHNLWTEGDRLYVGYYQAGLRVLDISGELRGDLYRQGRELAVLKTTDANTTTPNWPMTWGAQVFKGHIITSDLNSGLWILRLDEETVVP